MTPLPWTSTASALVPVQGRDIRATPGLSRCRAAPDSVSPPVKSVGSTGAADLFARRLGSGDRDRLVWDPECQTLLPIPIPTLPPPPKKKVRKAWGVLLPASSPPLPPPDLEHPQFIFRENAPHGTSLPCASALFPRHPLLGWALGSNEQCRGVPAVGGWPEKGVGCRVQRGSEDTPGSESGCPIGELAWAVVLVCGQEGGGGLILLRRPIHLGVGGFS